MLIEPDEVGRPICMRIARDDDVVSNFVVIQSLKGSVSIRLVTILTIF